MDTETQSPPNRKLIPFKLPPDLIRRLKDRASQDGTTVTALVESGAERELAARDGKPEPAAGRKPAPLPARTMSGAEATSLCARCGHARTAHWARGCLAGCPCGERLYRQRA